MAASLYILHALDDMVERERVWSVRKYGFKLEGG